MFRLRNLLGIGCWLTCTICLSAEPILWLDAGHAKSLKVRGDLVESWMGRNAEKTHFRQADEDRRPRRKTTLNGRATLHFDGDDFLESSAVLSEGDDTFTIIALWRPHRLAIQSVFEQAGPGGGRRAALLQVNGAYGFNGQSNDFHNAVKLQANQWRLSTIILTGADRDNVVVIDNKSKAVTGTIDIERQNVGVDRSFIGKKVFGSEFLQGDVAEIRIFDTALNQGELSKQLTAIKKTWGLKFDSTIPKLAGIPANQPKSAPTMNLKPTAAELEFFETSIRPLLVKHCFECHSGDSKIVQAGLRLDGPQWVMKGGDSGAAVVPGNPAESLLLESVRYESFEMPPSGKLSVKEIAALDRWVKMGVPWPGAGSQDTANLFQKEKKLDWAKYRREHWAFRPVKQPQPPEVRNTAWAHDSLDQFVLARLEAKAIAPNPPADKRTLIRRAYFDLIGLPPTPQQVESFVNNDDPQAFAAVVDELLASKHYGERWTRHWLDVARYSDGLGGFLDGGALPDAWRYRDWCVAALNNDMPYNEFVRRQIAGDLLTENADPIGTGFFAVGPTYRSDGGDPEAVAQARAETLADRVDTFSRAFLGLTAACARCHDHKFDPITTRDYYAIAGIFNNTRIGEHPLAPREQVDAWKQGQAAIKQQNDAINKFITSEVKRLNIKDRRKVESQLDEKQKADLEAMRAELKQRQESAPRKYPTAHVLADSGSSNMHVALRGDLRKRGPLAPRRFFQIIAGEEPLFFKQGSGRRELADAVIDPTNPLTARVIVNRVWQWHFGEALVRTPSNFGTLGERPTHPELLDWLTARFVENGWSLKALHRDIMLSATWQMSSDFNREKFDRDGENRLLWRMNPRKLEVEVWRDSLLAVTGELDRTFGGQPTNSILGSPRRTLYTAVSRNGDRFVSDEFLRLFDFPAPRVSAAERAISTVPQQYLFMLNNKFMEQRALALAMSLQSLPSDERRIRAAYMRLYSRSVSPPELKLGLEFLATAQSSAVVWPQYAQVLLSAHEFLQVR